jgi:hypothetical protein
VCSYQTRIGTVFTTSSRRFIDLNPIKGVEFFQNFESLGVSNVTNYNWTRLSEQVRSPAASVQANLEVRPGKIIQVQQLVGYCDQIAVRTEILRTVEKLPPKIERCIPKEELELVYLCDASGMNVSFRELVC